MTIMNFQKHISGENYRNEKKYYPGLIPIWDKKKPFTEQGWTIVILQSLRKARVNILSEEECLKQTTRFKGNMFKVLKDTNDRFWQDKN